MNSYSLRITGYKEALKVHNIQFRLQLVVSSRLMEPDGARSEEVLLSLSHNIDGMFATNLVSAIGAMKLLKMKGIRIPQEVAMIGFSNESIFSVKEPSLITIDQSDFKMGKHAMEMLVHKIKNGKFSQVVKTRLLETKLIKLDPSKK